MKKLLIIPMALISALLGAATHLVQNTCGPFTDVPPGFCPFIVELYNLGITAGTSPTTFSPDMSVTRGQAAVFVSKGIDISIQRSSRRAALGQWWLTTPHYDLGLGLTMVDGDPQLLASDGEDLWIATLSSTVQRVRASDGRLLETWTGADGAFGVLVAMGRVFITGRTAFPNGGRLYMIDPTQPPGPVTTVADSLWIQAQGIAFDGTNIWVSSAGGASGGGALSIVTPGATLPWSFTTIKTNVLDPAGILYDGRNIWFAEKGDNSLKKLDAAGNLLEQVPLNHSPEFPVFDGANIWIPSQDGHLTVVSTASGSVLAILSGNGLVESFTAAFDGARILVPSANGISVWNAARFSPIGSFTLPASVGNPFGVCSDGVHFWVTIENSPGQLARF